MTERELGNASAESMSVSERLGTPVFSDDDNAPNGSAYWNSDAEVFRYKDSDGTVFDWAGEPVEDFDELDSDVAIAPDGDDSSGDGSYDDPYFTLEHAAEQASAGERVVCRGGTYVYTGRQNLAGGVDNGTSSDPIIVRPYATEQPVFDFDTAGELTHGIQLYGLSWWEFHDVEIVNVDGSGSDGKSFRTRHGRNILLDGIEIRDGYGDGFSLDNTTDVTITHCLSHQNQGYDGADGVAIRESSSGTVIEHSEFHYNGDDGIDLFFAEDPVTMRYCAFSNNTTFDVGSAGAIKLGSEENDDGGGHTVHHCAFWDNGHHAITFNRANNGCDIYNCVAYNSDGSDFHLNDSEAYLTDSDDAHVLRNCQSVTNDVAVDDSGTDVSHCTFDGSNNTVISQSDQDIRSLDENDFAMWGEPGDFLRLGPNSDCMDAGADVGLEFEGDAPDISGYECGHKDHDPI